MLIAFLLALRSAGLKTSLTEWLALLEALKAGFAQASIAEFYALARTCLVKDESQYDRFDRAFKSYFDGVEAISREAFGEIPEDWLRAQAERLFSAEERARIQALGGLDELLRQFAERMREQDAPHHGGSRFIGSGGTSPFGHSGYHPEGIRVGGASRNRRAVKVWEQRAFANLDDNVELGTRNLKLALRQLRRFSRLGADQVFDLDATIDSTARNAGWLDLRYQRERRNAVKVLLLIDNGGSMDEHVRQCEELFSAAKSEFKHLEHYYFHNFIYERLWKDNARRFSETTATFDLLHTYPADYRLIIVGDASMAPYEISHAGGSVEHWNEEPGAVWLKRLLAQWSRAVWLNPVPEAQWGYSSSIGMTRELLGERMFPLTLAGLGRAIERLRH
ncbi:MAG: VWA domain-containing protein [Lysobacterales bacterium]